MHPYGFAAAALSSLIFSGRGAYVAISLRVSGVVDSSEKGDASFPFEKNGEALSILARKELL